MKYNVFKNDNIIKTVNSKLELYKYWEDLYKYLRFSEYSNFDCSCGFWMMPRTKDVYEAKTAKGGKVSYDLDQYQKMVKGK